jgi:hypothetical protein
VASANATDKWVRWTRHPDENEPFCSSPVNAPPSSTIATHARLSIIAVLDDQVIEFVDRTGPAEYRSFLRAFS